MLGHLLFKQSWNNYTFYLKGGFYEPTHTCLPRCKCSCTPEKNSEYSGLTNFIANICEGKRSQNGMRSVTQIGDEYLNKAKDYECDDSLFGINNSMVWIIYIF